jgi:hypothetical protein
LVNPEFLRLGDLKKQSRFPGRQMNVSIYFTNDYDNLPLLEAQKKQTQSKPICILAALAVTGFYRIGGARNRATFEMAGQMPELNIWHSLCFMPFLRSIRLLF